MGIRQLLLASASLPSIYAYSGVLTVGQYYFENPDPPPFEVQTLNGFGDYFGVFGDLSPAEMSTLVIQQFYYEYSDISGVITDQLFLQATGTDALSTKYPTINDFPMVNGGIVGSVNTAGLLVNMSQNLLQLKYQGGAPTLRFALRTDIIQAAGTSTLTVPSGATRAVIYALGGGGGGARTASSRFGGGNGAYCVSDISVASGQWGTSMSYTVGAAGVGRVSSAGNGTAGGATTVTHAGLGVSISAGGGGGATTTANGTGGTASGGATSNTNGNAGTSAIGFNPANEVAFQNSHQGGAGGVGANGQNGRAGLVAVVWY